MTPYYEDGWVTIYHGDCREIMPSLKAWRSGADALITDPPYGIGWTRATWDEDPESYPALMRWLVETARVVVPNGWCFVFQAMPNVGRFHEWFPEGWRLYAACKNFAQIRPTGIWHSWDPVVFWENGMASRNRNNHEVVNRDFSVGNVAGVFRELSEHPAPKPIDTMRHLVAISSLQGHMVVDPFMGSGTTLVAAKALGRRAIGIEIEEKYCEIAVKRLRQEVLPL